MLEDVSHGLAESGTASAPVVAAPPVPLLCFTLAHGSKLVPRLPCRQIEPDLLSFMIRVTKC